MASTTEPIPAALLALLRCPETGQTLTLAPPELCSRAAAEAWPDTSGHLAPAFTAALLRADGTRLYPIREGLPVLLVEESIPVPPKA